MEHSPLEFQTENHFETRIRHYQDRAEKLLNTYGKDFNEFTEGENNLVTIGDEMIRNYQSTGYNILKKTKDMPLRTKKPLIFYGMNILINEQDLQNLMRLKEAMLFQIFVQQRV